MGLGIRKSGNLEGWNDTGKEDKGLRLHDHDRGPEQNLIAAHPLFSAGKGFCVLMCALPTQGDRILLWLPGLEPGYGIPPHPNNTNQVAFCSRLLHNFKTHLLAK